MEDWGFLLPNISSFATNFSGLVLNKWLLFSGLDYWTHIFLVFTHSVVTYVMSLLTKCLQPTANHQYEEKLILVLLFRNAKRALLVIVVYVIALMLALPNLHHFLEKETVTLLIALL